VRHRPPFAFVLILMAACLAPSPALAVEVVFIANGSGDLRTVTAGLRDAVAETRAPLDLETFVWSHGFGRYLRDHVDHPYHVAMGYRLAEIVSAYRRSFPDRAVYLIGHSAGSDVVLTAATVLPPGSIERIVLLDPSVSADYDLRPALRTVRCSIDSFYSEREWLLLGLGTGIAGNADGGRGPPAGRVGFCPVIACPGDAELYAKLRQHPWNACVAWTGDHGGHYGSNRAAFLRAYVLPLLVRPPTAPPHPRPLAPEAAARGDGAVAPGPAMPYHGPGP
jgi:pimeloyl-ACP methyl ester carboxylesterase